MYSSARLEVVWQLCAAGVSRVHSDEDAVARVKRDLAPLEDEAIRLHLARLLDGQNLLRDHRENLRSIGYMYMHIYLYLSISSSSSIYLSIEIDR